MTTRLRIATIFSVSALCLGLAAAPATFAAQVASPGKSASVSHKYKASAKTTKAHGRTAATAASAKVTRKAK